MFFQSLNREPLNLCNYYTIKLVGILKTIANFAD
jgi:hypothetical protein